VANNLLTSLVMCTLNSLSFLFEYRVHNYLISVIILVNVWLEIHVHRSHDHFIILLIGEARLKVALRSFIVVNAWLES
jgi:hypothetical protein